jgi:hypothetical protein
VLMDPRELLDLPEHLVLMDLRDLVVHLVALVPGGVRVHLVLHRPD